MLTDLKNNPAQLGASLVRTPEREDQYYWISPVTAIPNHVYVKANSQLAETGITSLSELSGVAVRRNDYRHTLLEQAEVADILAVNSWEQAIELLLADRVNALLYSSAGLRLMCEKAHMDCSELNPIYTRSTVVSYIVLPKVPENAELANVLSAAAAKFKSQQQFEALTEKLINNWQRQVCRDSWKMVRFLLLITVKHQRTNIFGCWGSYQAISPS